MNYQDEFRRFDEYDREGRDFRNDRPVDEGPQPLIRETPDPPPYPADALGPLKAPAEALAKVTEAPLAMCAGSILAAAALAAQGLRDAETLAGSRPASLYLLTVAESGERKSTADKLAMRGVRSYEAGLCGDYDRDRADWQDQHSVWDKRRAAILKNADKSPGAARADLRDLGPEPKPPLRPNMVAASVTVEGIVRNLPELRASLGIMTDEGGHLLGGHAMKAENRLATLATLAAMWDGSPLDRWRAGDGVSAYSGRRFSSHLLIQPAAAEAFLADPLANGQGLLARFLICRPMSHIGHRLRMARDGAAEAELERFAAQIEAMLALPLALAEGKRNELSPEVLPLSEDARAVLTGFAREVEKAQAPGGPFETARAAASKAAEQAARLAAVQTIFANPDAVEVTGETMAGAVELATYYTNEAARLADAAVIPAHVADAEQMRRWLLGSWREDFISAGIAAQRGPFKLTERSRAALQHVESYGWLVSAPGSQVDGKPRKEAWRIVRDMGR